ncbi:hypothetical protein DH2020_003158 [Rehmannia glutinosa]|uniref:WAT1-related protein n=1 Tax=Rehmannia glutinosa TaxID=99300 RepID=A0ABR0XKT1_REHGL
MVIVQLGYAGMNIISKLAMDSGMNPFVHVAYRQVFATVAIAPFAYFMERITVNQITYFVGLKNSTPTIACALSNINPAVTFIMAVPFGPIKYSLKYAEKTGTKNSVNHVNLIFGPILLILSAVSWAIWLIIQGIVCSALAFCLMSWCIERKGPLYVSVFSPLLLVIVAILSWALLDEKLYAGT